jgi:hypothetical protein
MGVLLYALEGDTPWHATTYPLGVFSLFLSALGPFVLYRVFCYVCERFFGKPIHLFNKEKKKQERDILLTVIRWVVLLLIGVPFVVLAIIEPVALLIPAFLLLPFAAQAGLLFDPLYGWLTAVLLVLFLIWYAIACHRMKKADDIGEGNTHIESLSWFSMVLLFYVHLTWIFFMKVFAIVLAIESYRPSLFFF